MERIDCTQFKACLSGYMDDELTRAERLSVDAHIVQCTNCHSLLARAEALDQDLKSVWNDAETAVEAFLPADFESRVFAAISLDAHKTWRPRVAMAAAAVLLLSGVTAWWILRPTTVPNRAFEPGNFGSGGSFATLPVDTKPSESAIALATITPDDSQAMYATAILLDGARHTAFVDQSKRELLRETATYDELITRLDDILPKLSGEAHDTVALARDLASELLREDLDETRWQRVQSRVAERDLSMAMDRLSAY